MPEDRKLKILKDQKTLNPHPEKVKDELFSGNEFFDANDMVQVKYEMLRRVQVEKWAITKVTEYFGFSRPSFYKIQQDFAESGLVGLLPEKSGPKKAHKLTEEVMDFIEQSVAEDELLRAPKLAMILKEKFGLEIHPRSIERALANRRKKRKGG